MSKYREVCCNVKNLPKFFSVTHTGCSFRLLHSLQVPATYRNGRENRLNQFKVLNFAEHQLANCWYVRCRLWEASRPTNRAVDTCGRYAGRGCLTRQLLRASKRNVEGMGCLRN